MLNCVTMMHYCIIWKSNVMDNKFNFVKFYIKKSLFLHLWCINVLRAEAQGTGGSYPSQHFEWGDIATHIPQFLTIGMFHFYRLMCMHQKGVIGQPCIIQF